MGPELPTPRSTVMCSTDRATQVPFCKSSVICNCVIWYSFYVGR